MLDVESYNPAPQQIPPQGSSLNLLHPQTEGLRACYLFPGDGRARDLVTDRAVGDVPKSLAPTLVGPMILANTAHNCWVPWPLWGGRQLTIQLHVWLAPGVNWIVSVLRCYDKHTTALVLKIDGTIGGGYGGWTVYSESDGYVGGYVPGAPYGDWLGYFAQEGPVVSTLVLDADRPYDGGTKMVQLYRDGKKMKWPTYVEFGPAFTTVRAVSLDSELEFGISGNYHIGSIMMWDRALQHEEVINMAALPYDLVNWPIGYRGPEELPGSPYHYSRRQRQQMAGAGIC